MRERFAGQTTRQRGLQRPAASRLRLSSHRARARSTHPPNRACGFAARFPWNIRGTHAGRLSAQRQSLNSSTDSASVSPRPQAQGAQCFDCQHRARLADCGREPPLLTSARAGGQRGSSQAVSGDSSEIESRRGACGCH